MVKLLPFTFAMVTRRTIVTGIKNKRSTKPTMTRRFDCASIWRFQTRVKDNPAMMMSIKMLSAPAAAQRASVEPTTPASS